MTVLSMHHWQNKAQALNEIARVTRESFVALTWCPKQETESFWLYRDYLTNVTGLNRAIFPKAADLRHHFRKVEEVVLPIPYDCADGFDGAYWQRPEAFLDPKVRANMSVFSKIDNASEALLQLKNDLDSGRWHEKNAEILELVELDVGYRLFIVTI